MRRVRDTFARRRLRNEQLVCRDAVELLGAYLEDALPAKDRVRLEAHLTACEPCTAYLAQLRASIRIAGTSETEALEPGTRAALTDLFRTWNEGR